MSDYDEAILEDRIHTLEAENERLRTENDQISDDVELLVDERNNLTLKLATANNELEGARKAIRALRSYHQPLDQWAETLMDNEAAINAAMEGGGVNIYDEKRRNAVEAYCTVQLLTPTERCIQLEDELAEARKDGERLDWFERQWGVRRDPLIPRRAFTFAYLDGTSRAGFQPLRYEIDAAMDGEG